MNKRAFASLFIALFLLAAFLHIPRLGLRPMHHDEANQAVKFGQLLEEGKYRYDPADHHGPSLYYITLPFARVLSGGSFAELSEATLRFVTATFGLGTMLLLLLFIPMMGRPAVAWAALALAVSPAMVYFSRFYIQETLLVFFIVGFAASVWRYLRRPGWGWAAAAGVSAGLMYATKETSVIAFGAFAGALLIARPWRRRGPETKAEALLGIEGEVSRSEANAAAPEEPGASDALPALAVRPGSRIEMADETAEPAGPPGRVRKPGARAAWSHGFVALGLALVVSFLLFSSFFRHPAGFLDSIRAFSVYFHRAAEPGFHTQPWHYYLGKLAFSKGPRGAVWTEGLILLLALAGAIAAFGRKRREASDEPLQPEKSAWAETEFARFLVIYSVVALALYSAIPYKTPWNLLPFYIGFIIAAGIGAAFLVSLPRRRAAGLLVAALLAAGFVHLGVQSYRQNFRYPADERNPYVYAQTSPDFLRLVRRIEDLAPLAPARRAMLIKVIAGPYETWPLPWYLREFSRVGYWTSAAQAGDLGRPAVIISSAQETQALEPVLGAAYRSEYYGLRPGVLLTLSVRNDLWETLLKERTR